MNDLSKQDTARSTGIAKKIGWTAFAVFLLLIFEELVNIAALNLYPHHDTAACAGADTFCSPDGAPGLTGGAAVFLIANAFALICLLIFFVWEHKRRAANRAGPSGVKGRPT